MRSVMLVADTQVIGGAEKHLLDLIWGLHARRYAVSVVCVRDGPIDRWLCGTPLPSIDIVRLPALSNGPAPDRRGRTLLRKVLPHQARRPLSAARELLTVWRWARVLRRRLRSEDHDAVVANNGGYPGAELCLGAVLAARRAGVRRVLLGVHNIAERRQWPAVLHARFDQLLRDSGTSVVTYSKATGEALATRRGWPASIVSLIYYGVTRSAPLEPSYRQRLRRNWGANPADTVFAMVGSFEPRKGHDVLFNALRGLTGEPPVRVVLLGDGPGQQQSEAMCRAQRLPVAFAGHVTDVPVQLQAADVLVHPSIDQECLPYAILEAMAAGLPVIGSRVGGIPEEIEHGITGILIDAGDPSALRQAMTELARNPTRRARLGAAGRIRCATGFSLEHMLDGYEALLNADWRASAESTPP